MKVLQLMMPIKLVSSIKNTVKNNSAFKRALEKGNVSATQLLNKYRGNFLFGKHKKKIPTPVYEVSNEEIAHQIRHYAQNVLNKQTSIEGQHIHEPHVWSYKNGGGKTGEGELQLSNGKVISLPCSFELWVAGDQSKKYRLKTGAQSLGNGSLFVSSGINGHRKVLMSLEHELINEAQSIGGISMVVSKQKTKVRMYCTQEEKVALQTFYLRTKIIMS